MEYHYVLDKSDGMEFLRHDVDVNNFPWGGREKPTRRKRIHGDYEHLIRLAMMLPEAVARTSYGAVLLVTKPYVTCNGEVDYDIDKQAYRRGVEPNTLEIRLNTEEINNLKQNVGLKDMKTSNKEDWKLDL